MSRSERTLLREYYQRREAVSALIRALERYQSAGDAPPPKSPLSTLPTPQAGRGRMFRACRASSRRRRMLLAEGC